MMAVGYAIVTMLIVILLYDQLLFRPLIKWSEKFKSDDSPSETSSSSWVLSLFRRAHLISIFGKWFGQLADSFINCRWFMKNPITIKPSRRHAGPNLYIQRGWDLGLTLILLGSFVAFIYFILQTTTYKEILHVFFLGAITALRIIVLIIIASAIWVPVGVWVGMRPRATQIVQPIAQFLAAFPANLLFPIVVLFIVKYALNVEIWTTPLMILGTQWYILFNVIAGAINLPKDLYSAAANFGVKRSLWWRRLALPAVFPYYVTGALTAAGGAWNASIVAEVVYWGDIKLEATGLGAYIAEVTTQGDFPRIFLGIGVMCLYVLAFNRLFWQRLYNYAQSRYRVN